MPKKYDPETRAGGDPSGERARRGYASEWEAITTVAGRLGMNPETLRK